MSAPGVVHDAGRLSPRQREIWRLLALGYSQKELAWRLHLSPQTVKAHTTELMRALGLHDRVLLCLAAVVLEEVTEEDVRARLVACADTEDAPWP